MSSKTLKVITTVLGVLFLLFGLLMTLSGLLGVIGIAGSGLVENTISPLGQTLGDVPYAAATFGGLLILLLGITYIVAGFGLLTNKSWSPYALGVLGVVGLVMWLSGLVMGETINPMELVWSLIYLALAYYLHTHPNKKPVTKKVKK